jgi:predicted component of type VI protein secretion system
MEILMDLFFSGIICIILIIIYKLFDLQINKTQNIEKLNNRKIVYDNVDFNLLRNALLPLNTLYITNRIIEANRYLKFYFEYITIQMKNDRFSEEQIKIISEDIMDLRNLLVSLSLYKDHQFTLINNISKILKK